MSYTVETFDEQQVLDVLRKNRKPMAWSRIVMAIRDIPYEQVKIAQVRGVRDACRSLEAKGLVREAGRALLWEATAA